MADDASSEQSYVDAVVTSLRGRENIIQDSRKAIEAPPELHGQALSPKDFVETASIIGRESIFRSERKAQQEQKTPTAMSIFDNQKSVKGAATTPAAPEPGKENEKPLIEYLREKAAEGGATGEEIVETFPVSKGLTTAEAKELFAIYGPNELPEKVTPKWLIFCSQLWQPMPVVIWIAAIIEAAIGNYIDTGILVAINLINATLSYYETTKAGDAVAALKSSLKPTAVVKRDGNWDHHFDSRQLVPGDLIELVTGAAVPADCMINPGHTIDTDESAMTGETIPVTLTDRMMAKMGGTVARGEGEATVVLTGKNTFFGKTAAMLGGGDSYSNLQKLLLKIIITLSCLAFVLCATAFGYLLGTGEPVKESLSFAVVLIVASIPMAIEIVCTTTLAMGSRNMSDFGAIVSRLAAIEDMAGLNMLCSDKTGTLTKNKMEIQTDAPTYEPNISQMDLLKYAAMAARWDAPPKDALDTLVLRCHLWYPDVLKDIATKKADPDFTMAKQQEYYDEVITKHLMDTMADYERLDFLPFDPRIKRTESVIKVKSTGAVFKVTKGAPHVIQKLDPDEDKGHRVHDKVSELGEDGIRAMAIAISDPISNYVQGSETPVNWRLLGMLTFLDPPRDDTKDTIAKSEGYGVPVRMITGDHLLIAKKTCKDLNMGNMNREGWPNIQGPSGLPMLGPDGKAPPDLVEKYGKHIEFADGFAQVFPEHKFLIVETFRRLGYKTGMTGDGVNDAPALKRADVGIAVAGATDAARAAADIVLTREGLSTIVLGMEVSRKIFHRMRSFLTYRIAATLQLLFFFFISVFAFHPDQYLPSDPKIREEAKADEWESYFKLPVIYLMIITVINDGTLISIGYDHAVASRYPDRWNLPLLFTIGGSLGMVACFSSLILLYCAVDSWRDGSLFQRWGIGGVEYGHVINLMFLKVAVTDILTLFSSRTGEGLFFSRVPHPALVVCCAIALTISTILSLFWPCGELDSVPVCGLAYRGGGLLTLWVWLYSIFIFVIQDLFKVGVYKLMFRFNIFNIRSTIHKPNADGSEHELG